MDRQVVGDAPGLRERRRIRQKQAIQDDALKLFVANGYEQTTIDDIAHAAAISPRTFFRYFPTKEDVVLWDEYDERPLIERGAAARASGDPLMTLVSAAQADIADMYEKNAERLLIRVRLAYREPEVRARFLATLVEFVWASYAEVVTVLGGDPEDDQFKIRLGAIYVAIFVAVERWQRGDGKENPAELIASAIGTLAADWPELAEAARAAASTPQRQGA
jgi:AcrR family transcriptional regulator